MCQSVYDLCIIDGPKNWTIDGGAFFMVDKILKDDGWLIFDDYLWTYAGDMGRKDATDGITHRKLSAEERNIPHVKEIFEILVMQHPNYSEFFVHPDDNWVIARKKIADHKFCSIEYTETNRDVLVQAKHLIRKFFHKYYCKR